MFKFHLVSWFLVIIDLSWKMTPKLDPDMTNGMGIRSVRTFS
jgi:hypothetical protein